MSEKMGRPTVMTPETIKKLEEAFLIGCSDEEACLVADISRMTLHNYQTAHPDFIDRKNQLRQNPNIIARKSVIKDMTKSGELALKYLSKKKKDEFSDKIETEHSGEINIKWDDNDSGSVQAIHPPEETPQ